MLARQVEQSHQRIEELERQLAEARHGVTWATGYLATIDPRHPLLAGPMEAVTLCEAAEKFISSRIEAGAWKRTEG